LARAEGDLEERSPRSPRPQVTINGLNDARVDPPGLIYGAGAAGAGTKASPQTNIPSGFSPPLVGPPATAGTLRAGETWTFTGQHVVVQADLTANAGGCYKNTVSADPNDVPEESARAGAWDPRAAFRDVGR